MSANAVIKGEDFKIFTQPAGFEPARAEPIGFRVQRLNHSATTAAMRNPLLDAVYSRTAFGKLRAASQNVSFLIIGALSNIDTIKKLTYILGHSINEVTVPGSLSRVLNNVLIAGKNNGALL